MKINMSHFKKIHQDKDHAVLKHSDGHEFKISVAALSPSNRKQLDHMPIHSAEGGEAIKLDSKKEDKKIEPSLDQDKLKKFRENSPFNEKGKRKGEVSLFAKGGKVDYEPIEHVEYEEIEEPNKVEKLETAEPKRPVDYEMIKPKHPVKYERLAEGGIAGEEEASLAPMDPASPALDSPAAPSLSDLSSQLSSLPGGEVPAPAVSSPAAPQAAMPQTSMPEAPMAPPAAEPETMGGYDKQVSGIQAEANAEAMKGQEQANAMAQQAAKVNKLTTDYQDHFKQLDEERKSFQDDILNKHIDPNRYLGSLSTGGRIQTAIGLILGGLGGGGHSNMALDFLNKQIDKDIDAQKAELGKKETLLSANMRQFGNLRDATDMTKIMQNDMLVAKLKEAEAKATSPIAKANAQQKIGQLEMQVAPMVQQLATRRMLSQVESQGGGATSNIDPAKLIPSVVPEKEQASAFKELQEAQNMSTAKNNIMGAFSKLSQLNTVANRLTSPVQTARQVAAIKDPIVAGLSKATAGRFTEQDAGMLESLFPKYGDNQATIKQKKTQIDHLISEKMHFPVLNAYGLNPEKFTSTSGDAASKLTPQQQSFAKFAKENPNDPRSALILKKLGL